MALMFSSTCSTRLAPVMTVDTCGFLTHQASDIWAKVHPSSSEIAFSDRTFSLLVGSVSMERSHSYPGSDARLP